MAMRGGRLRRAWSAAVGATLHGASGSRSSKTCSTIAPPRFFQSPWQSRPRPGSGIGGHCSTGRRREIQAFQHAMGGLPARESDGAVGFSWQPIFCVHQRGCHSDHHRQIMPGAAAAAEIGTLQTLQTRSRHFVTTKNWAEEDPDEDPEDEDEDDAPRESADKSVKWHVDRLCPTSLRIRQLKERDYDDIIEREKKLKIVLRIKDLLAAAVPGRALSLQELGKSRDDIGLTGKRRIIAFLKRYPAVFEVHETAEPGQLPWFRFTPEADAIYKEEVAVRRTMQVEVVTKLRKLLMMSSDRRLLLVKIAHIGRDLGLPDDFRKRLVYNYPKYFRVVDGEDATNEEARVLELVKWSDRLAVTEAEKKTKQLMQEESLETPPRLDIRLPKRYRLSNKDKYVIYKFHELECPSPYQDSSHLHPASAEAEKRAVLVVQELLSLTLEKRVFVDHLTHFRKEFKFSNQVRSMLVRHPEHFYVSKKGARDTVFLRDAFEGFHVPGQRQEHFLKEKHPLVLVKEKLAALMDVKRAAPPAQEESSDSSQQTSNPSSKTAILVSET